MKGMPLDCETFPLLIEQSEGQLLYLNMVFDNIFWKQRFQSYHIM